MISHSRIVGFGAYVPEKTLDNFDLENMVDTSDEWIVQRTGIHKRHILDEKSFASDLAIKAVEDLVERTQASIDDVDHIIVTSFTPDYFSPTMSALVQSHFGIKHAGSFDLNAGCTGFAYALSVADALITAGQNKKVLVVAAEAISKVTNYEDRATCILFGDAGAACLLEYTEGEGSCIASCFHTDGHLAQNVTCSNFNQTVNGVEIEQQRLFDQNGQQVYKYVMTQIPKGIRELLDKADLTLDTIDWFVPHSANMRIVQVICDRLPFPEEKTLTSIEYYGNTSSASIPLAIWIALNEGRIQRGDLFVLYGFGGGLTHGGLVLKY